MRKEIPHAIAAVTDYVLIYIVAILNMGRRKRNKARRNPPKPKQQHSAKNKAAPAETTAQVISTEGETANKQQETNTGNHPARKQQQFKSPIRWPSRRCCRAFAVVVELVLAGAVAYFAYVQADVTDRQLGEMRQQSIQTDRTLGIMELEQRPWIASYDVWLKEPLAENKHIAVRIDIHNFGNTPGRIIERKIYAFPVPKTHKFETVIKDFENKPAVMDETVTIPPQGEMFIDVLDLDRLSKTQVDGIEDKSLDLYVFCQFIYVDAWKRRHHSECCYLWIPGTPELALHMDGRYNNMDTDVPRNERGK